MEGGEEGIDRVEDSKDLQQQSKALDKLTDHVEDRYGIDFASKADLNAMKLRLCNKKLDEVPLGVIVLCFKLGLCSLSSENLSLFKLHSCMPSQENAKNGAMAVVSIWVLGENLTRKCTQGADAEHEGATEISSAAEHERAAEEHEGAAANFSAVVEDQEDLEHEHECSANAAHEGSVVHEGTAVHEDPERNPTEKAPEKVMEKAA
ncbi:hypothetical protein IFM89_026549 [Coptis chinensis]|uniref:Uncharacterized protein n=1 Tax=Coptis chinensis TaxID=261450 RepID=A0A835HPS1_9MAGN|nr:hypothetical protein IFM89_026549 [Coptis chinensis]